MRKEQITIKEGICILIIFIMGSTFIVGVGGDAKNSAWISVILGAILAVPMMLVYGRIALLFPGKDLYDILETVLGKTFARIVSVIYIWYIFHLGALVIRNFGEFINVTTLPETPMIVSMFYLGIVCVVSVKSGIEVIGRISAYVLPIIVLILVIVQILGISILNFRYLKPIIGNGFIPILKGAFSAFSFPFAESVVFMGILFSVKNQKSQYKILFSGLVFAAVVITILTVRNTVVLGEGMNIHYFPSLEAVGRIAIGEFIERIEVSVSIVFVFGVFVKTSICLLTVCRGIAKVFNLDDYRSIVIQTGLLMIYLAHILYSNTMEMRYWAFKVYKYYAFPFQVIIPLLLLLIAELKVRKKQAA
ncbi:endospore germination permease [Clostridium sp. CX1]|uniref:GerAB/ArcD/ProY family transporter n=1 Tax=Clostridium sp. CX1 TaxID=2978346 RepID=UPI0021C08AB0|nr:endospore germination permease [Clostridium sp. CX1]MCT8978635.1 endospore germination permease [Clostridium sp. CX1]